MADYYSRLLELRRTEGAARGLAKLPADFYGQTRSYLAELKTTFESELRENPAGRKGELARQTHQRSLQLARDIVEARMTKILTVALQESLGGSRELPNALTEERELHEDLAKCFREHRSRVAPYLEPFGTSREPRGSGKRSTISLTIANPPATAAASPRSEGTRDVALVRMLADSPRVAVGTETIALRKDDVVSLPTDVARLLIEAHAAEPVVSAERGPLDSG